MVTLGNQLFGNRYSADSLGDDSPFGSVGKIFIASQVYFGYPIKKDDLETWGYLPEAELGSIIDRPQDVGAPRGRKIPAGASPAREIVGSSR